jgi:hypothetical protein
MDERVGNYRTKALECAALALSARNASVRLAYEKLVRQWNDLADSMTLAAETET